VTCADGQACSPRRAVLQPHLTRTGSTSVVNALTRLPVSATASAGSRQPSIGRWRRSAGTPYRSCPGPLHWHRECRAVQGFSVIADFAATSSTNSGGTTIQPTVFGLTWAFEVRLRNPGQLQPALIGHQPSQCCRPARVLRNEWAPPRAMQGWAAEAHCDVSAWPAGTRTGAMSQSGRVSAGGRLRGGPPDRLRDHRPQPRGSALAGRPHRRGGPASHRSRGRSHGQGRDPAGRAVGLGGSARQREDRRGTEQGKGATLVASTLPGCTRRTRPTRPRYCGTRSPRPASTWATRSGS
jgi:hypothetical protein